MPLVVCPDCGAQVSDAAPSCHRCGRPAKVHGTSSAAMKDWAWNGALRSRAVQVSAILVAILLASSAAPRGWPDAMRLGSGIGVVVIAAIFASLVFVWQRSTRGYIPILALLLSVPLILISREGAIRNADAERSSVQRPDPATRLESPINGAWVGSDRVRSYSFDLREDSDGNLSGTVEYPDPDGSRTKVGLTGSRLGSSVLIRLLQTGHTPWVLTGRLVNSTTISGEWSVGDMVLEQVTMHRR